MMKKYDVGVLEMLERTGDLLLSDQSFIGAMVKVDAGAFTYASTTLHQNANFVMKMVDVNHTIIKHIKPGFMTDPEFILPVIDTAEESMDDQRFVRFVLSLLETVWSATGSATGDGDSEAVEITLSVIKHIKPGFMTDPEFILPVIVRGGKDVNHPI